MKYPRTGKKSKVCVECTPDLNCAAKQATKSTVPGARQAFSDLRNGTGEEAERKLRIFMLDWRMKSGVALGRGKPRAEYDWGRSLKFKKKSTIADEGIRLVRLTRIRFPE